MNRFRRFLPIVGAAVLAAAIGIGVVWFRQSGGRERVNDWWQSWRHTDSSGNAESDRAGPLRLETLSDDARTRLELARRDPSGALAAFNEWRRRYRETPAGAAREALVAEGVAAAEERRTLLRDVIALDPELALRLAVPRAERASLPAAVVARLEQLVSGRGDFQVVAAMPDGSADPDFQPVRREAVIAGRTYDAFVYGRRTQLASRRDIGLHGIAVDGRLALLDSPVRLLEAGEAPAPGRKIEELCAISGLPAGPGQQAVDEPVIAADTGDRVFYLCSAGHIALLEDSQFARESGDGSSGGGSNATTAAAVAGTKRVLFIRLRFANEEDDVEPQTAASVEAMCAEADAFLRENSFGAVSLTPVITPVYTLPESASWYRTHDTSGYALNVLQAGRALAANPTGDHNEGLTAFNYLDYDYEVVRYNGGPGTFSGQGYVGVRGCWMKKSEAGILAHELGHNFGLWHANYWEPDDRDALTGAGRNREYGDDFDAMGKTGTGPRHFNAAEKARLGWLPDGAVESVFVSGTHRVHAHDLGGTIDPARRYALRVPRGTDRDYWLEFRQHAGWAQNPWLRDGLGVRWDAWSGSNGGTQLLDVTPGSPAGKDDSTIVIGRTFSDRVADIHVTPLRRAGTWPEALEVDVQIGPFPGNRAPVVQLSAAAMQAAVGTPVRFTASASDPDGDELAYFWDFEDQTLGDNTRELTHVWSAAGDQRVRVVVSDHKGATASASVVVRVGAAAGARLSGRVLDLAGQPVADVRVATDLGSVDVNYREALTDSDGRFVLTDVAAGTWTLNATRPGWAFAPVSFANPLVVAGDASAIDFVGRAAGWQVMGFVRDAAGQPVAGALVSDGTRTEPTDENGRYAFTGVPVGTYALRVTAPGAEFAPVSIQVAYADLWVPTITETTFTLSGEITGVGATPVTISDGWRTTTSTVVGSGANARNVFTLAGVPAGSWHLRATAPSLTILPSTFANPVQVTGDRSGLVFALDAAAAPAGATIRGRVTSHGAGVGGATILAGEVGTTSDSWGGYTLAGVPAGTQIVSVAAEGLTFVPATREVVAGPGTTENVDFVTPGGNEPPVFTRAARIDSAVNRPFVRLSARATDDGGEAWVRYTWTVVGTPPGSVDFSANGSHGAADTVAQFGAAGSYRIRVTASDAHGAEASSEVTVAVTAVAVRLAIVPATLTAMIGEPVTLALQCTDQFGGAAAPTGDVTWSVNGGGSITRDGVFSGTTPGRGFVVTARMGGLSVDGVIDVGYARGPGYGLRQELWTGVAGSTVRQLTSLPSFPGQPTLWDELDGYLEVAPGEIAEGNFGERLRGFFVPPASGDYVFRIASSNASELWLSTSSDPAGRSLIASTPVAVGFRQWAVLSSQRSGAIRLTKDVPVYLEVLHKVEAGQDGHVSVGVELPGGVFEGPIPGHRLLPWGASAFEPPVIVSPARATPAMVGGELQSHLDVLAASEGGEDALSYTWSVAGVSPGPVVFLPNGTNAAKTTLARFSQPGSYALVVTATDAAQQSVTSSVVVTVAATFAAWQRGRFSAAELDDPAQEATVWGDEADPDGDGLTNLLEYAFGFDPRVPEEDGEPQPGFVVVDGVRYLAITFRRNLAAADVVYTPQATSDLRNWEVGLVPVGDPDAAVVTYRDFAPAESFDQRFLRVEVSVP